MRALIALFVAVGALAQQSASPLASADAAMQSVRFGEAAQQYELWLKQKPDSKEVLFALAVCYGKLGRNDEAIATLTRYVQLAPDSAAGHAALGIMLVDGARTAEARAELQKAIRLNPAQKDAVEALARISILEGAPERAVALLRPLTAGDDEGRFLLADALVRSGDVRGAAAMLDTALAANSQASARLYALAASAHASLDEDTRAAEICERGLLLYPDSDAIEAVYGALPSKLLAQRVAARIERAGTTSDVNELISLGRILTDVDPGNKTRAHEFAKRVLSRATELAPTSALARYTYALAQRDVSPAAVISELDKAARLPGDDQLRMRIYTQLGMWKQSEFDYAGAEQALRTAFEINRTLAVHDPEAALQYVQLLKRESNGEQATAVLDQVLSWNPLFPAAHMERARLLADAREWNKAIADAEFVVENAGSDKELLRSAHVLLARGFHALDQPEKAQLHRAWVEAH